VGTDTPGTRDSARFDTVASRSSRLGRYVAAVNADRGGAVLFAFAKFLGVPRLDDIDSAEIDQPPAAHNESDGLRRPVSDAASQRFADAPRQLSNAAIVAETVLRRAAPFLTEEVERLISAECTGSPARSLSQIMPFFTARTLNTPASYPRPSPPRGPIRISVMFAGSCPTTM
jgi:hypothetical protein